MTVLPNQAMPAENRRKKRENKLDKAFFCSMKVLLENIAKEMFYSILHNLS